MPGVLDSGLVEWLKKEALYSSVPNAALPAGLLASAVETELVSPLVAKAAADAELARQIAILGGPLALDRHVVKGQRRDLVGKCITLSSEYLGYSGGKKAFVISADEQDDGLTVIEVVRSLGLSNPFLNYALALDFSGGEYWAGGVQYGATDGAELISPSASGWTQYYGSGGTVSLNGSKHRMTSTSGQTAHYKGFATVVGKLYRVTATIDTLTGNPQLLVGASAGIYEHVNLIVSGSATFVASSTTTYFHIVNYGATGTYSDFTLSMVEVAGPWALSGYSYTRSGAKGEVNVLTGSDRIDDFAANVPGIVPSVGYWSRGALTNIELRSAEFDNASWDKYQATVTANAAVAPDGTTSMDKLIRAATNDVHQVYQSHAKAASAIRYTTSRFLKAAELSQAAILVYDGTSNGISQFFNLATGAAGSTLVLGSGFTSANAYVVDCGGGIYRCVLVYTTNSAAILRTATEIVSADGVRGSLGDGVGGIYAWGAQTIEGDFPDGGPIVATAGATAAIGEDSLITNIKPDGTALADQDFLLFSTFTPEGDVTGNSYIAELHLNGNDRVAINHNSGQVTGLSVVAGSVTYGQSVATVATAGVTITGVLRRLGTSLRIGRIVDGVLTWGTSSVATIPTNMTKLGVGNFLGGGYSFDGSIEGSFLKLGTFTTDADVLAAVAESA